MDILHIIAFGFIVTLLSLTLKNDKPEFALQLSLVATLIIFILILGKISVVLELFRGLAEKAGLNPLYLEILLKIIGIAYLTEFGAQVCRDANEGSIAGKIEFAGKVMIMMMAVPILTLVFDTVTKLLP